MDEVRNMYPSIGVNLSKEIKSMMRRVKIPATTHVEECIYCCDSDDEYDFCRDEAELNCAHEDYCNEDDCSCSIKDYLNFDFKVAAYLGIGLAIGVVITSLFKKY